MTGDCDWTRLGSTLQVPLAALLWTWELPIENQTNKKSWVTTHSQSQNADNSHFWGNGMTTPDVEAPLRFLESCQFSRVCALVWEPYREKWPVLQVEFPAKNRFKICLADWQVHHWSQHWIQLDLELRQHIWSCLLLHVKRCYHCVKLSVEFSLVQSSLVGSSSLVYFASKYRTAMFNTTLPSPSHPTAKSTWWCSLHTIEADDAPQPVASANHFISF